MGGLPLLEARESLGKVSLWKGWVAWSGPPAWDQCLPATLGGPEGAGSLDSWVCPTKCPRARRQPWAARFTDYRWCGHSQTQAWHVKRTHQQKRIPPSGHGCSLSLSPVSEEPAGHLQSWDPPMLYWPMRAWRRRLPTCDGECHYP